MDQEFLLVQEEGFIRTLKITSYRNEKIYTFLRELLRKLSKLEDLYEPWKFENKIITTMIYSINKINIKIYPHNKNLQP